MIFYWAVFLAKLFRLLDIGRDLMTRKAEETYFLILRELLAPKKPEGFLLENVKNLKSHDGGKTFKIIEEAFKNLGYHMKIKVLNTMEYGNIPQNRERIYMVGFKNKEYSDKFEFPSPVKLTKKSLIC